MMCALQSREGKLLYYEAIESFWEKDHEASTSWLGKELQATKEYWEQEK